MTLYKRIGKNYLHNSLRQCAIFDIAFRSSLNEKKAFCVFGIHPFDVRICIFSSIMAKLSIPCCNKKISRGARRKVLLQIQVDIVRVIEDEEPISVGLTRKPVQTRIHCSLSISWGNSLEICLNSIFARGVDVEDIEKA